MASLTLVPNRASVVYNLVHIYYLSKNVKKLDTLIDQCEDIKNTKEIKLALAYKEYFNKNYKESIKIAESLINYFFLQTEDDQILFLLALNYKCLGNYLKTLNIYRKILFRNRDDDAILENIGFFFLEQGKIKKAYHYLKKGHSCLNFQKIVLVQTLKIKIKKIIYICYYCNSFKSRLIFKIIFPQI